MTPIRWSLAYLAQPPATIYAGSGALTESHRDWVQESNLWTLFYYHHANSITIGTQPFLVDPGDIVFLPPGAICNHSVVGEGREVEYIAFDLPASSGLRSAIPHACRQMQDWHPSLRRASNKVVHTLAPARAFVWNLLCFVGESSSLFREVEDLYIAEDFIQRHLGDKFAIQEIADAARVSPRSLLKLFRAAHGVTIQEFILRKRVQEASSLLIRTDLPIKVIASRVGMADLQYFNKTMRAIAGISPSKMREVRPMELTL